MKTLFIIYQGNAFFVKPRNGRTVPLTDKWLQKLFLNEDVMRKENEKWVTEEMTGGDPFAVPVDEELQAEREAEWREDQRAQMREEMAEFEADYYEPDSAFL